MRARSTWFLFEAAMDASPSVAGGDRGGMHILLRDRFPTIAQVAADATSERKTDDSMAAPSTAPQ
jgi:hypothetical protein